MDLQTSLDNCQILISLIDTHVSNLQRDYADSLIFKGKAKAVWKENNIHDYVNHLHHQTAALSLLLTALNCRSQSDQGDLLSIPGHRKIVDQVKEDSSSLRCLIDSYSLQISLSSSNRSSNLSRNFEFDKELLASAVYQGQITSLMKEAIRKRGNSNEPSSFPTSSAVRSMKTPHNKLTLSIKQQGQRDIKSSKAPLKILLLRSSYKEKFTVIDMIKSRGMPGPRLAVTTHPEPIQRDSNIILSEDKGGFGGLTTTALRFLGACRKYQFIEPNVARTHGVEKTLGIFNHADVIVFEVDMSAYDGKVREGELEDGVARDVFTPLLDHAAGRIQKVCASPSAWQTPVLPVLLQLARFREKIRQKPLDLYCPDQKRGMDGASAADCIKHRFLSARKTIQHRSIEGIFLDGDDPDFASKLTKELSTLHVDREWRKNGHF